MTTPRHPDDFLNIHEVMTKAAETTAIESEPTVPYSFRIRPSVKQAALVICNRNGTDLATYLKTAVEQLVSDYGVDAV